MNAAAAAGVTCLAVALASGCTTVPEKYSWGKYDTALYASYKDPTKVTELFNTLEAVVKGAGATHAPVAPGIYAEYGYLLLQQGKASEATPAFQQEKQHWPESAVFMDRMIKVATQNPAAMPAKSQ